MVAAAIELVVVVVVVVAVVVVVMVGIEMIVNTRLLNWTMGPCVGITVSIGILRLILNRTFSPGRIFCPKISLLTEYFVLKHPS
jgi:hypothetical protein